MAQKSVLKYDAFISYRHSELDSFVAENVHHELEKFKLPKNLVKKRGADQKSKIERVFRDRDELPIAADLSENITEALERSDFLVVICTPRLKESMWCKAEIDSFIALRGRERVLAVLAEGEPADSFPEQITKAERVVEGPNGERKVEIVNVEPLAADVRGKNKSEIKKKIKEEVMRLAAAMFECNYDEIRQRHREQVLKRRIKIAAGVTAVSLAVGAVSAYQAITINKQSKKIEEQYGQIESQYNQIQDQYEEIESQYTEIERQYNENLAKQTEIVVSQAQNYLSMGNVDAAKQLLIETYDSANGELPADAEANLKYIAGEIIRAYDAGYDYSPIVNLSMDVTIKIVAVSYDYRFVMAFDSNNNLSIWSLETYDKVYEAKTDFIGNEEFKQNYFFDDDNNFYYLGENSLNKISCEEGKEAWSLDIPNAARNIVINDTKLFVVGGDIAYIVDMTDGSIVKQATVDKLNAEAEKRKMMLNSDASGAVVFENTDKDNTTITRIEFESLTATSQVVVENANFQEGINTQTGTIAWESSYISGATNTLEYSLILHCIDENTLEEKWAKEASHYYTRMMMHSGRIIAYYAGGIMLVDPETLEVLENCYLDHEISDITVSPDGLYRLYLSNAALKYQNEDDFTFFETGDYNISYNTVKAFKAAGRQTILLPFRSNKLTVYSRQAATNAKEVADAKTDGAFTREFIAKINQYNEQEGDKVAKFDANGVAIYNVGSETKRFETNTVNIDGVYLDVKSNTIIIKYFDDLVELRDAEDFSLCNSFYGDYNCSYAEMDDEHFIVGDSSDAYVINNKSRKIEAVVHGFVAYNKDTKSFQISSDTTSGKLYEVPNLSLADMIKIAKQ